MEVLQRPCPAPCRSHGRWPRGAFATRFFQFVSAQLAWHGLDQGTRASGSSRRRARLPRSWTLRQIGRSRFLHSPHPVRRHRPAAGPIGRNLFRLGRILDGRGDCAAIRHPESKTGAPPGARRGRGQNPADEPASHRAGNHCRGNARDRSAGPSSPHRKAFPALCRTRRQRSWRAGSDDVWPGVAWTCRHSRHRLVPNPGPTGRSRRIHAASRSAACLPSQRDFRDPTRDRPYRALRGPKVPDSELGVPQRGRISRLRASSW